MKDNKKYYYGKTIIDCSVIEKILKYREVDNIDTIKREFINGSMLLTVDYDGIYLDFDDSVNIFVPYSELNNLLNE